jgi:hypothetical protein
VPFDEEVAEAEAEMMKDGVTSCRAKMDKDIWLGVK